MIKRIDRYVGWAAISGILLVWMALTLLMQMFNLLSELGDASGNYRLPEILWFVMLTTPRSAYTVFPVSALLGSLIGIGGLAAMNELVALRTAGVSRMRIAGSALGAALLATIPVVLSGEWLSPAADAQARSHRQRALVGTVLVGGPTGLWIRDRDDFIHIQRPLLSDQDGEPSVEFHDVDVYSYSDESRLRRITRAHTATHDGSGWQLHDVSRTEIAESGVRMDHHALLEWDSSVKPEVLDAAVIRPQNMSVRMLLDQMEYMGQNGLSDRVYRAAFWNRMFFPLTVIALVLGGMPFLFGSSRQHSLGVRLFIGMTLGGLFMIVNRTMQNMGDAYQLPSAVTSAAPSVLLVVAVIWVLRRSA